MWRQYIIRGEVVEIHDACSRMPERTTTTRSIIWTKTLSVSFICSNWSIMLASHHDSEVTSRPIQFQTDARSRSNPASTPHSEAGSTSHVRCRQCNRSIDGRRRRPRAWPCSGRRGGREPAQRANAAMSLPQPPPLDRRSTPPAVIFSLCIASLMVQGRRDASLFDDRLRTTARRDWLLRGSWMMLISSYRRRPQAQSSYLILHASATLPSRSQEVMKLMTHWRVHDETKPVGFNW